MKVVVNPGLTVEDIWTKNIGNIPDISNVSPQYREAVQKAYRYGITNGKDASYTFGPKDSVTRAQVCQMIANMGW